MTALITCLFLGLVIGALAKHAMPGRDTGGLLTTALLGVTGAALGGWLSVALGWYPTDEPAGFLMALAGSVAILSLHRFAQRA